MRVILSLLLVLCLATAPLRAYADDAPAPAGSELVTRNGVVGMWFPMDTARRLLLDVQELRSLRDRVLILNEKLELRAEVIQLWKDNAGISSQQAEQWHSALTEALAVHTDSPSFWDSRELWFFLGFAVAGAAAVGLSYGLNAGR